MRLLYESGVTYRTGRILFLGWSYKANVGDRRDACGSTGRCTHRARIRRCGVILPHWWGYPDEVEAIHDLDEANGFDAVVLIRRHMRRFGDSIMLSSCNGCGVPSSSMAGGCST